MWRTVADSAAPQRHFGIRSPVEAVKFHPEFRLTLIQCKAKFEWNLDRAHSWAARRPSMRSFCAADAPCPSPWGSPGMDTDLPENEATFSITGGGIDDAKD